ncbi:O-antigen ligase family protein [Bradyrhizobium sp.]|uniref:O-antigen ligase family protein n=1 Tax=Bradyrhizobium sp. TaxID=376 RepID=UPI0025C44B9E|nr:O-antigen ligase family protein [Bradyrhizobium sp.]
MTIEFVGAITLVVGIIGLFVQPSFIVYAFFASTLLGAAAAFILTSLGGATVQPAHLLLGFLAAKLLADREVREGALRAVTVGSPGFWLLVTVVYSTIAAYAMPRLFQGQTLTFSVRAQAQNYLSPLAPTTSNLTQSLYLIGDCVCFVVVAGFGSTEAGRRCLGRAALMCVILSLLFAGLDLVTYATGTTELLSFIRNSTYSILSDTESAGFKRIVGSFVEASSFGYWTLGYFAFVTSLWLNGVAVRLTFSLSVLSFFALLFSTSTTAYVGLLGYLLVEFAIIVFSFLFWRVRREMFLFMIAAPFVLAVVIIAICLNDATYAYFSNLMDTFVFKKLSTDSGVERSSWNSQAIRNFLDTYGFGAGNGSVRASSFPIAAIASLGFVGAASYAMFLLSIWFRGRQIEPSVASATQVAARSACLAWLIAATASAGFIDLGLPFFAFAALGCLGPPRKQPLLSSTRAVVSYQ